MVGCGHCCCPELQSAWMAAHMSSSAPVSHSCYKDSLPRHTGVIVSRCLQSPVEGMCDTARWIYLDFPSLALDATGTSLLMRLPGRHLQVPEQGIYMYSAWRGGRADHGGNSRRTSREVANLCFPNARRSETQPHWLRRHVDRVRSGSHLKSFGET
jgi:hypothetical protein